MDDPKDERQYLKIKNQNPKATEKKCGLCLGIS